jgi:hypothetical protein
VFSVTSKSSRLENECESQCKSAISLQKLTRGGGVVLEPSVLYRSPRYVCLLERHIIIDLAASNMTLSSRGSSHISSARVLMNTAQLIERKLTADRDPFAQSCSPSFRVSSLRVPVYVRYSMMWCAPMITSGTCPDAIAVVNQR